MNRFVFDAGYLERLRAGDAATERHFCEYFSDLILIKVRTRGLVSQFDDIRQETFVRVLRTLGRPDGLHDPGALGAFVWSVCNNVILEQGRSQRTRPLVATDEPPDVLDPAARSPEAQLALEEERLAVRAVIKGMTPRDREVLAALLLDEEERDRLCGQLGVTKDYLRVLLHRARRTLRTRYLTATDWPAGSVDHSVRGHTRER